MSSPSFTDPNTWSGGFYELAIHLGKRDDVRLEAALRAVAAHPGITGWYGQHDVAATEQVPIRPTIADLLSHGHLFGFASVPGYPQLVCGCMAIRYDEGSDDWFYLYIPMGALGAADDRVGAFPFGDDGGPVSLAWRAALDRWFADVARIVFNTVPFDLALIGIEVPVWELPDDGNASASGSPESREYACLIKQNEELLYYPATQ